MGRPRGFDETQALDGAMRAFWLAGYEATSTTDLCAATGLGRSSVYNAFSDKRSLFLAALRRYDALMTERIEATLAAPGSLRDRVRTLMLDTVSAPVDQPPGCLMVNTIVELGPSDPEVMELISRHTDRRKALLRREFETAIASGEIAGGRDPEDLVGHVVATITGLRVAARGGTDPATLTGVVDVAIAAI